MRKLRAWLVRWGGLFGKTRQDRELAEELESHLQMHIEENLGRGMSPEEARRQALIKLGGIEQTKENYRDRRGFPLLESVIQDVHFGLRMLRKNPGFTAVAVLTLAIGIGGTTAIFSILDGVLLKPLPYPSPQQLVSVSQKALGASDQDLAIGPSNYFIYREQGSTFQDIGIYWPDSVGVTGIAEPEQVRAVDATDGILPILGVTPMLGRWFNRADDSPGSPKTVILTYGYWRSKFGGDPSIIGRNLTVNGQLRQVVGVMPQRFHFLDSVQEPALFLPLQLDRTKTILGQFRYGSIARLKPGVTLTQANADVAQMLPVVLRSFPPPPGYSLELFRQLRIVPNIQPLKQVVVGHVGGLLWILMGSVGLVLLIACANIANLLLVRADARWRELAIREAVGATRGRIARQLLVENLLIGLLGGVLGLALACGAMRLLAAIPPATLPRLREIGIDLPVLVFTFIVSVLASLLFGSIPLLKFARARLGAGLREGGRFFSQSREWHRARNALVVVQVVLAFVLVICSALMVRTFRALTQVSAGFARPAEVQTLRVFIPYGEVSDPEKVVRMQEEMLSRVAAVQGISSASLSSSLPMEGNTDGKVFRDPIFAEDRQYAEGEVPPIRWFKFISPGFFQTVAVPLVAGRDFTWADIYSRTPVAIVSKNLAREYWGDPGNALGKRIRASSVDDWREIIGVAGDVHDDGLNQPAPTTVYWPILMNRFDGNPVWVQRGLALAVRSPRAGSASLMDQISQAVWSVDASLPLTDIHTLDFYYERSLARTSFTLVMLGIAGAIALLLGAVGLYGVIAYSVSQRTREIGIRVALGAQHRDVRRMVLSEGAVLAFVGVLLGVPVALAMTRLMAGLLYGVKTWDLVTYVAVTVLLCGVALLACWIPARRAMRVDPMVALRYE